MASVIVACAMVWLFFAAYHLIDLETIKDRIDETRYELSSVMNSIVDAETGQRGYLLTNNVSFLEPYQNALVTSDDYLKRLSYRTKYFPELKKPLRKIARLKDEKFRIIESSLQVQLNAGSYASHLTLSKDKGKQVMDEIRSEIMGMESMLVNKSNEIEGEVKTRLRQVIFGSVFLVLVICAVMLIAYKSTVKLFEHSMDTQKIADEFGHQAMHDPLTKIPNRRQFDLYLGDVLSQSFESRQSFALYYMDLDGFKTVNDVYGHDAGDEALIITIKRISETLRDSDFMARIGGDEFTLIVQDYTSRRELEMIGRRIIKALDMPIKFDGKIVQMGISIGIACYPADADSMETLIVTADNAMYTAKQSGKHQLVFAEDIASSEKSRQSV